MVGVSRVSRVRVSRVRVRVRIRVKVRWCKSESTRARLVECFGGGRRRVVKRAIFDLVRSGKNELSHSRYF